MRRISILAISALCVFVASCNKDERPAVNRSGASQYAISFVNAAATKAYSENTADDVQADGFGIACVTSEGGNLFIEKASWDSGKASYFPANGPWFYPSEGKVSFYGVYPPSQTLSFSDGGIRLSYTQNSSEDLLAVKKTGVAATASPVALSFDHILSLIHFAAVSDDDSALYKVKSVSIKVPSAGIFAYDDYIWTPADGTKTESCFEGEIEVDGKVEIPSALTFIPCNPEITLKWDVYSPDGDTFVASHEETRTLDEALEMGEECTVTLLFAGSDAKKMDLSIEVKPWTQSDKEIELN